eukprot:1341465-Pyramimonas_sp.AAC.1
MHSSPWSPSSSPRLLPTRHAAHRVTDGTDCAGSSSRDVAPALSQPAVAAAAAAGGASLLLRDT